MIPHAVAETAYNDRELSDFRENAKHTPYEARLLATIAARDAEIERLREMLSGFLAVQQLVEMTDDEHRMHPTVVRARETWNRLGFGPKEDAVRSRTP